MPGKQDGGAGEGRQIPDRAGRTERRGETALPDGPAIKGRNTPARLPPRFPAPGKCTSHLGFGLVDLISETTERICGFKPEPDLAKQFLAGRAHAPNDALDESPSLVLSRATNPPSAKRTRREGRGPTLPITLDPQDSADFLDALLRTKEAWLEVSYSDGRKEVRRWDASRMSTSSNVIGNLRSRPEFRNGTRQKNGIASLRVSVEHPRSKDA